MERTIVIGDVHGCTDELGDLLEWAVGFERHPLISRRILLKHVTLFLN